MNRQVTEALSEARGLDCREASLLLDVALSCQWDETEREEDELPELGCDPWAIDTVNFYTRLNKSDQGKRECEERAMKARVKRASRRGQELWEESWLDYAQELKRPEDDNRAEEYANEPKTKPESKLIGTMPYLDITPLIAEAAKELYYKLGKGKGYFVKGRKDEVSDEYQITVLQAEKEIGTIRLKYIVPNQSFDQDGTGISTTTFHTRSWRGWAVFIDHELHIRSTLDKFYKWLTIEFE